MILALVQARMGSGRLPGKVLTPILGVPLLARLLDRLRRSRLVDQVVVATGNAPENEAITRFGESYGVPVHVGSEPDVLHRFTSALDRWPAEGVVRITGDCPLVDPEIVDHLVRIFRSAATPFDYVTNAPLVNRWIAQGSDVEVFASKLLRKLDADLQEPFWRENFTPYVQEHVDLFNIHYERPLDDLSSFRITVDYPEDLAVVEGIFRYLECAGLQGRLNEILSFLSKRPDIMEINRHHGGSAIRSYREACLRAGLGPSPLFRD